MRLTTWMLADGARSGADGKLYIFGGQWDRIFAPAVPMNHPSLSIVLVVEVEYGEALDDHRIEAILRDADGNLIGPRGLVNLRTGHPAHLDRGCSLSVPITMELSNVQFPSYGRFEWAIEIDGAPAQTLPLTVAPLGFPGAASELQSAGPPPAEPES